MNYRRRQTVHKTSVIAFVGAVILILVLLPLANGEMPPVLVTAILMLVFGITLIFTRLTVVVAEETVTAAFGFGWPRHTIQTAEVTAVRQVRNRWYQGWGIRLLKDGWMYNVWGLDAVELDLTSGRKFRIGTDDLDGLLAALTSLTRK